MKRRATYHRDHAYARGWEDDEGRLRFRVGVPIKSPNRRKQHWGAEHRYTERCQSSIDLAIRLLNETRRRDGRQPIRLPWGDPVDLLLVRSFRGSNHIMDRDNMIGGSKRLIDSLTKAGLIIDDSPDHLDLNTMQLTMKTKRTPSGLVTVEYDRAVGYTKACPWWDTWCEETELAELPFWHKTDKKKQAKAVLRWTTWTELVLTAKKG